MTNGGSEARAAGTSEALVDRLRKARPGQRPALLTALLREQIARRLCLHVTDVEPRGPLVALGMSSLQAVEMKTYWERELGLSLRTSLLFDYPTLEALVPYLLERLSLPASDASRAGGGGDRPTATPPSSVAGTAAATSRAVAEALAAELADLRGEGQS